MHLNIRPEIKLLFAIWKTLPFLMFYNIQSVVHFLTPEKYRRKKDIAGQVVLITGAGSGIGRELAIKFSRHDSTRLFLLDLNMDSLLETQKLLDSSAKSFLYNCDVSKRDKVYEIAAMIKYQVGKVDILVNNAGIVSGKFITDLSDDDILKTMEVNALAHFWTLKAFLPEMVQCNSGHIVSISSQAGLAGIPKLTDYCASKYAAFGLMESLRIELDSRRLDGIKTTVVCPNMVSTGLFEGMKTKVTQTLNPERVAQEIMNGILEDKTLVSIPHWPIYFVGLRYLMPEEAVQKFVKFAGIREMMTNFIGRKKEEDNNIENASFVFESRTRIEDGENGSKNWSITKKNFAITQEGFII